MLCQYVVSFIFLHNFCIKVVYSEIFSATSNLESLLHTEESVIQILSNYIQVEERRLNLIKSHLRTFEVHHKLASNDVQSYLHNPINAFTLVKRLTADWEEIQTLISTDSNIEFVRNISKNAHNLTFPEDEDLNGVAVAITRLQDTYQLNVSSLAEGQIKGIKYTLELSASDYFEIGKQSFINGDCYHSSNWMNEARRRIKSEENSSPFNEELLEYLAFCAYKRGDLEEALNLTREMTQISPKHPRANHNQISFEEEIEMMSEAFEEDNDNYGLHKQEDIEDPYSQEYYEALCRGDIQPPLRNTSKLKCRYIKRNSPFLLIAPFKVEEANLEPDIYIFHDILSDDEIEIMQKLAKSKLARATVIDPETGKVQHSSDRISQSAWLGLQDHPLIQTLTRRVGDMTGLSMTWVEPFHVGNYGTGGFFDAHYDFIKKIDKINKTEVFSGLADRLATVLIYMSDVEMGGATVFPLASTTLWPQKGTAVFWHNLFPSGDGDYRTRHAACPVLMGSKWVSNKWIHEKGQEFLRPCTKEQPPEEWTI